MMAARLGKMAESQAPKDGLRAREDGLDCWMGKGGGQGGALKNGRIQGRMETSWPRERQRQGQRRS